VVALVGGEPTLLADLFDLVTLARSSGARGVVVQTNGRRLAYAAYAAGLQQAGATAVDVSLPGATAAMHEFHTNVEGSFAQTVRGLGVARAAGLVVGVTIVATRSNYRHLAEIVRLGVGQGARFVHVAVARAPRGALASALTPARDLLQPHLVEAARVALSLGARVLVEGRASHPSVLDVFAGAIFDEPGGVTRPEILPALRAPDEAARPGAG
jgi:MoaA/NifB/PqqE/SkfB family radical SAM enzyme